MKRPEILAVAARRARAAWRNGGCCMMRAAQIPFWCQAGSAVWCIPAGLTALARRADWRGRYQPPAPFSTLAGVTSVPSGAIPGGRGGPQSVAPILPTCRAAFGRAARAFLVAVA